MKDKEHKELSQGAVEQDPVMKLVAEITCLLDEKQKRRRGRQAMTERDWESLYRAAATEADWTRIEEHIQAAESAITDRMQTLSLNGATSDEKERIVNAAMALEALRNDVAKWRSKQA